MSVGADGVGDGDPEEHEMAASIADQRDEPELGMGVGRVVVDGWLEHQVVVAQVGVAAGGAADLGVRVEEGRHGLLADVPLFPFGHGVSPGGESAMGGA